jgi:hypothetical protein
MTFKALFQKIVIEEATEYREKLLPASSRDDT